MTLLTWASLATRGVEPGLRRTAGGIAVAVTMP
jgi:hypothetical protein